MEPCTPVPAELRGDPRAHRWTRVRRARAGCARALGLGPSVDSVHSTHFPTADRSAARLEELWDRHGCSVYAMARTLLGDEAAAARVVSSAMVDLAESGAGLAAGDAHRDLSRHVYLRSEELVEKTSRTHQLPTMMVRLGELAQLQRACLALCVYGGHTYAEAADLLGVPPMEVAELLRSGLRDVARSSEGDTAATA